MQFYSTRNRDLKVSFREALLSGIAPDGGLYMPEKIPQLSVEEISNLEGKSFPEVAYAIGRKFIAREEIPDEKLREICDSAYNYEVILKSLNGHPRGDAPTQLVLELFHGPTLAFKDFAARFMARCADFLLKQSGETKTILVATSGDTGGAIGNGFLGMEQVKVVILYPKGGVSPMQEKQLTTMGQNVFAVEIDGTFDDCQRMVKEAFLDQAFAGKFHLMSANSINVGRIIPQSFYYAWASLQFQNLETSSEDVSPPSPLLSQEGRHTKNSVIFSVPSGNFGNVFGGVLAKMMGFPIEKFIVANNANHPFFDFWKTGEFEAVQSVHTLSNAMDIGHPNNYYRIVHLFEGDLGKIREIFWCSWFDDEKTAAHMQKIRKEFDYVMCPHTAVGNLGVIEFKKTFPQSLFDTEGGETVFVTVGTAHPAKFVESVEEILGEKLEIPNALVASFKKEKQAILIGPDLEELEGVIEGL